MLEIISNLETTTRALRQALIDRGLNPALSISWYGDNINAKPNIYLISEPAIPVSYSDTIDTFVKKIFAIKTLSAKQQYRQDYHKRNQVIINQMKGDF